MESTEILLSSPCGYYGELALWPFRNLRFAAAAAADAGGIGTPASPRSHFCGIRLLQDGSSWRCEAALRLSPAPPECWVPFASLHGTPVGDEAPQECVSYFPSSEADYSVFDKIELSDKLKECLSAEADNAKATGESRDGLGRRLAEWFLPRCVPGLRPLHHANYELPNRDDSFRIMGDWLSRNRGTLLRLRNEQVDGLLHDVADEFARRFQEIEYAETQADWPIDARSDLFLMSSSDFFVFLSRILRLHWYLGQDNWGDVIAKLDDDGGFPQTRPPSLAWIYNHRDDAPWWHALRTRPGDMISVENEEFLELDLIALAHAWLWPAVYQQANEDANVDNSLVPCPLFPSEQSIAEAFRRDLAKLGEWWTHTLTKDAFRPLLIAGKELDSVRAEDSTRGAIIDLLNDRTTSTDDLWEAIRQQLSHYKDEMIQAENWETRYHEAFPSVGDDLTIEQLLQKDRLGFALKELETEVEGEPAWVRLVYNTVFEDAYGPQALATRVKKEVRQKLFAVFGSSALVQSFTEKSNHCQILLREFVVRLLKAQHGRLALDTGVPDDVKAKVKKKVNNPKEYEKLLAGDEIGEFFRKCDLTDYILVLEHQPNRAEVGQYLRRVGIELSAKGHIKPFWEWKDKRNAAAHPEKASDLSSKDMDFLDDEIRCPLYRLLLLTAPIPEAPKSD